MATTQYKKPSHHNQKSSHQENQVKIKVQTMKQTEIGWIPEDWEVASIKDMSRTFSGGTPSTENVNYYRGNINWISSGELNQKHIKKTDGKISESGLNNSSAKLVEKDTLLIAMYGATAGVVAITGIKGAINQAVLAIINEQSISNNIFLYNYLELKKDWILITYTQGGQPNLNQDIIKNLQIPLPPLPEQEAIATALSDCDAWIDSLEAVLAKKRLIKQGAMQELLTPKKDWEVKKLGEVASYRRGSFPQPYGLDKWYDNTNGMPFIQVFDVAKNRKLKNETKSKISALAQPMSVFVPKGTIVLTIQGSIGRIALIQYDAYCDRTLLIFQKIDNCLEKFFFLLQVEQIFEMEKEKAPGGTIKTITKEALSDFVISFPKSLTEQTRIATILSDMDAEIEALERKLEKARQIKQGMMQELLTGRVRLV